MNPQNFANEVVLAALGAKLPSFSETMRNPKDS